MTQASREAGAAGDAAEIGLASPLVAIPRVGPRRAQQLAALGLTNVGKLVAHLPSRHEWREAEAPITEIQPGGIASAVGEVTATRIAGRYPRQRLEAKLTDGTGAIALVWFNGAYLKRTIQPGVRLRVQGRVAEFDHRPQMANPAFTVLPEAEEADAPAPTPGERRLWPVYPAGEGLKPDAIAEIIAAALPHALPLIDDHLPEAFRKDRGLPTLADAYRMQHAPADEDEVAASRRRLAYDDLLLLQLGVQLRRGQLRRSGRAPALRADDEVRRRILQRLPHELTAGQRHAAGEIADDLSQSTPCNRLVQGDVGSGKTLVAAYAMLLAVASGHQAALMAPTEVLAEQHAQSLRAMLQRADVRLALLTGTVPEPERASMLAALEAGEIDLVVGTHALLTDRVRFRSLAVAIIDEQHRFGVEQRAALRAKAGDESAPHTLVMTATPIPRTVAVTLLGDLDVSTIDDLPAGRKPVRTEHVPYAARSSAYARVRACVDRGERAFVVAPAIGGEDAQLALVPAGADDGANRGGLVGVADLAEELGSGPLNGVRLGVLHGKIPTRARDAIMERFRIGEIQVLVATTIIEVGVDVPEASCIVIEQADRFGLAQLHQLRGRVGRGGQDAECMLLADPATEDGTGRISAMCRTNSGFELADADFALRGPGELFGSRQSGALPFKVADLVRDADLLELARRDAVAWIERSPTLSRGEDAVLRRRVMRTVGDWLGLADVG
ncbi:MAG: ATP-dependent DNA helicase RecG [Planctomycetota bacterium]